MEFTHWAFEHMAMLLFVSDVISHANNYKESEISSITSS